MEQLIKEKLAVLPDQPGCYLMKDRFGTVIYVGKAKVLKNRVRSYFTGSHDGKTQRLVSEIRDFEYIVTSSNIEVLILELNLIKKHDPKYNIMLKYYKIYPFIKITGERHPRLIVTRNVKKDKGKYFGPYPNVQAARETKKLLDRLYPLRKCSTLPDRAAARTSFEKMKSSPKAKDSKPNAINQPIFYLLFIISVPRPQIILFS